MTDYAVRICQILTEAAGHHDEWMEHDHAILDIAHQANDEIERLTTDLSTARQSLVEMASQRNGAVAQVRAAFESGYKAGLSVPDGFFGRTMESEWDKYAASTRLAKKGLVKLKPGRYDDVYQEGVRWLNESD